MQSERHYDAAIANGSDKSTASTRATLETYERMTKLRLHVDVPRDTKPTRRDACTAHLKQQVQIMKQWSEDDSQKIASLEASQKEMRHLMAQFIASQQSVRQPNSKDDNSASGVDNSA